MNIPSLDDEELTLPECVSPEEQRRFRRSPAVWAAAQGTAVIPLADSSRMISDLRDQMTIIGPPRGNGARSA